MKNNLRTDGIILRRVNFGEADRILTILTRDQGVISAVARGVRKEKSRLSGGIELFAICDLSLAKSPRNSGDLWTITGAKLNTFFIHIIDNYDKLQFGYDAIKLVARAADDVAGSDYFDLLANAFAALDSAKISRAITETWFYLQLASLGGHELNLATDENGMKLVEDARYDYDGFSRNWRFRADGRFDAKSIKLLRVMSSNPPAVVAKIANISALLDDCLRVAKSAAKV